MKKLLLAISLLLLAPNLLAWNLSAKFVNALEFEKSGVVKFTLFEEGSTGDEFKCNSANSQWFVIERCDVNDQQCLASVQRMGSMLLAAKLSGTRVHVQNNECNVTEVAVKPL